jgi:arylsulfatase A-like enzyme
MIPNNRDRRPPVLPAAVSLVAILSVFALHLAHTQAQTASRPNVILVVIDDMGWADLGCYGSKLHKTPHIDGLAAGGMRFTQGYAACPVCSPTRASILSGKWPARLHLTDWLPGRGDLPAQRLARPPIRQYLPLEEITIAELLHDAGYSTASIGKWHLGGAGFGPQQQGFDLNIAGDAGGSPPGYFAPFQRKSNAGKILGRQLVGLENAPAGSYLTDLLNEAAVRFIDDNHTRPFFLYLPHYTVHIPLQAKEPLIARYPPESTFHGQQNNPVYAAMIESLDEGLGRILLALDRHGIADNTIVIFTSDNGGLATLEGPHTPATSNAPLREGKGFLYEGGIREPLVIRWPAAIKSSQTTDQIACSVDLLPTIADLCGIELTHEVDGVSLAPVLRGRGAIEREALYWHYPHYASQGGRPGGAIRAGDWKLIEFYESGRRELFNLKNDIRESRNLAASEPERTQQLAAQLDAWRKSVGAQRMTPNPNYHPNPQAMDGTVTMPARTADVYGEQLRYEPLPHKNTLGYWTSAADWASFEFEISRPGAFDVELLYGCAPGSGGSTVEVASGASAATFTVQETGGFQDFRPQTIGRLTIDKPGRHTLEVRAKAKPGRAVMDLRQVRLTPAQSIR